MALFGIQRYMGDEDEKANASSNATNILEELHRKAEQRRKQLEESPSVNRKRKTSEVDTLSPDAKKTKFEEVETTPKSDKKKKKKKKEITEEEKAALTKGLSPKKRKAILKAEKKKRKQEKLDQSRENVEDTSSDTLSDAAETTENKIASEGEDEEMTQEDDDVATNEDSGEQGGIRNKLLAHAAKSMDFTVLGEVRRQRVKEVHRVLPDWLAHPSVVAADIRRKQHPLEETTGLQDTLLDNLKKEGITHLFPVQINLIQAILSSNWCGYLACPGGNRPRDICCSAPTGSGKTLAYVLPLIQLLLPRRVPNVRVLVVLPVADLANQVYNVFTQYCQGTNLTVARLTGHKTFSKEQNMLVKKGIRGYENLADIVVATPGRLVDHLNSTPGFSLEHLRFLVMDEADRMMEEYKQDWLHEVEKACPRLAAPHSYSVASHSRMEVYVQKLLFSATLSQNPEKLQELKLFHPKLFTSVVDSEPQIDTQLEITEDSKQKKTVTGEFVGKYTTPKGLTEYYIESDVGQKALMILYMLHHLKFRRVLCFTNSVESTHRLYLIMKLVGGDITIQEYSSNQNIHRRQRMLKRFANGKIDMLICSDAMARGMDMEGRVQYVLSYDAPRHLDTYVHRAGRTARAGHAGTALTLLDKKEIYHFKKMCKDAGKDGLKEMTIKRGMLKPYVESFQDALKKLPEILKKEKSHS